MQQYELASTSSSPPSCFHLTGVALGAVVAIGSGPIFAGLLERGLGGRWPDRRWAAATALAVTGIGAISLGSYGHTVTSVPGIVLALASGAAYAAYTVFAKRLLLEGATSVHVMGAAFGTAAVLLLPVLMIGTTDWLRSGRGLELAAYLAIGPTVIAYLLFAHGLRHLAASETTTIVLAEPVTATVLGVLVVHEQLGAAAASGIVFVIAGISVLARPRSRRLVNA